MILGKPKFGWAALVLALAGWSATGQSTGMVAGRVLDEAGASVAGAAVTLTNAAAGFESGVKSGIDGGFVFQNLPLATYRLRVVAAGFGEWEESVVTRSTVPVRREVVLILGTAKSSVTVSAVDTSQMIDPEATGTKVQMNAREIERSAVGVGTRGLEGVLLTFPGFAQNANGAVHPRGAHNQMTYVVDGMPISDQLTGGFGNGVDPNVVQTVEMFTGNIPAEYGNKVSSVVNITTKSGLGSGRKLAGSVAVNAGGFDTLGQVTTVSGELGRWGYTVLANTMKTHRYLDAVSRDNMHNGGDAERGFLRLDWRASERDTVRMNVMSSNAGFELANLRSQQANGMDARQRVQDFSAMVGWVHTVGTRSTWDVTGSVRTSSARLSPSAGDTPVTASQARRMATWRGAARWNTVRGRHNISAGVEGLYFPVKEFFTFGVTSAAFNDPVGAGFNPSLVPFDVSRGGRLFAFAKRRAGSLTSGYVQDNVTWGRWTASLGLRYDRYAFLARGTQWEPRVGISAYLKETGTVWRASYNRLYMPPPLENLLLSNTAEGALLAPPGVVAELGGAVRLIRPERQDFYEVGVQQAVGRWVTIHAAFYHKDAEDQQDNNNFFNTGIIFPTSLQKIRVNGAEGRVVVTSWRGVGGHVAFTHARAITTPPFTGGLFIGNDAIDLLRSGPFVIDHDQKLGVQGTVEYARRNGFYTNATVRYDSGLVANPSDPKVVASDPDYADLLPYVDLAGSPARVKGRTITDVVLGYTRSRAEVRQWEASVVVTNLFDRTALYNFQSIFVGTRLVGPRSVGARIRFYF